MRVKKIVLAAAITMVAAVTLAGCGKKSSSNSSVTTTGSTSGNYQGVIENGRYKVVDKDCTPLQNIIDEILALYYSTLYKLKFLA